MQGSGEFPWLKPAKGERILIRDTEFDVLRINFVSYVMYVNSVSLLSVNAHTDPCEVHDCPSHAQCRVFTLTNSEMYCEPTCYLNNGGCDDDHLCELVPRNQCTSSKPCPPKVRCFSKGIC